MKKKNLGFFMVIILCLSLFVGITVAIANEADNDKPIVSVKTVDVTPDDYDISNGKIYKMIFSIDATPTNKGGVKSFAVTASYDKQVVFPIQFVDGDYVSTGTSDAINAAIDSGAETIIDDLPVFEILGAKSQNATTQRLSKYNNGITLWAGSEHRIAFNFLMYATSATYSPKNGQEMFAFYYQAKPEDLQSDSVIVETANQDAGDFIAEFYGVGAGSGLLVQLNNEGEKVRKYIPNSDDTEVIFNNISETTYNVTYAANGGGSTVPTDETNYLSGAEVTVKFTPAPTRSNYTFVGWAETDDAATATYAADGTKKFNITDDVTLFAVWTECQHKDYTANNNGTHTCNDCYAVQKCVDADNDGVCDICGGTMNVCKDFEISEITDGQFIITVKGQAIGIENDVVVFTKIIEDADITALDNGYLWNVAQTENGWTIQNISGQYLVADGTSVVLSDNAFDWQYKKGSFYTTVKTKVWFFETSKKYYLTFNETMLDLSSRASQSTVCLYSINASGTHDYTSEVIAFANVTKETKTHGWWIFQWTTTTYTAIIEVTDENTEVSEVAYSLDDGGIWETGTQFSTQKDPGNFLIRVTDNNGNLIYWQYDSAAGATVKIEG